MPIREMKTQKPKNVINKKLLLIAIAKFREWWKTEEDADYEEWLKAWKNVVGEPYTLKNERLKKVVQALRPYNNDKVIKALQALGYTVE